jgi:hypothetical protein
VAAISDSSVRGAAAWQIGGSNSAIASARRKAGFTAIALKLRPVGATPRTAHACRPRLGLN